MITGFGNNTVSALASDITASQTTFSVLPGAGDKFAQLLTVDFTNAGSPHQIYAKLTMTDSQGTVFEICHLTNVSGDVLTVIRGQENTAAKGWALNDVIANFATRGSEESFVQIEQLQGGDYTSATAGGTPNALTVSIPSTYQNNNTNDWLLKTPLMITPIAANSGNVTVQLTLAGKVIGTFPVYKGNSAQLDPGDILANVPIICVMDSTKTFFTVINPTKVYSKLGTAAYRDVGTGPGNVMEVGAFGLGSSSAIPVTNANSITLNGFYSLASTGSGGPIAGGAAEIIHIQYDQNSAKQLAWVAGVTNSNLYHRTKGGTTFSAWRVVYDTAYKPSATDVGALPISGGNITGSITLAGGVSAGDDIHSDKNIHNNGVIQAGQGVYDTPNIRVYSPNNKPSAFDVGAVRQGGAPGMGNNAVYLGWDGSKLIGQVDSTSMGAMFCTYNKPTPTDVNCIQRDSCDVSGFEGGDTTKPYMRRQGTNQSIYLATQLWVIQNFVQSVRLAGRTVIADSGGRVDLPSGCVYTGMSGANYAPGSWGAY